jgi:hypothetical protein
MVGNLGERGRRVLWEGCSAMPQKVLSLQRQEDLFYRRQRDWRQ